MEANKPTVVKHADLVWNDLLGEAVITNVRHLASYNWIEAPTPTIAVPGLPARWLEVNTPKQLKKDSGWVYISQNAARHPHYPMEPLFRALRVENPMFDLKKTDLVSDRNNIRKLLAFVDPTTSRNPAEDFAISAECVGNTIMLCREETVVQEFIGPNEFRGYGHEFEKRYTKCDILDSTSHHRIVEYCFSGLSCIIRHETDAFSSESCDAKDDDGLLDKLASLAISKTTEPHTSASKTSVTNKDLKIVENGRAVPINCTIEIKTKAASKALPFGEVASQLWISQTPQLVRAYHTKGLFSVPVIENVKDQLAAWQDGHQDSLRKLADLMSKIIRAVKQCKHAKLEYSVRNQALTIQPLTAAKSMLPGDVYSHWLDTETPLDGVGKVTTPPLTPVLPAIPSKNEAQIQLGDNTYTVVTSKFPNLDSFAMVDEQQPLSPVRKYRPIPHFDTALKGVNSGFRHCFRSLGTTLTSYQQLCTTLDELGVTVLDYQRTLDRISQDIKSGRRDDESERGDKRRARDTAFQFVYFLLTGRCTESAAEKNKAYNIALFILSHPATFRYKIRSVTRAAVNMRMQLSPKQRASLDKWDKNDDLDRDDETTESEPWYYSSDSDIYW